MRLIDAYLHKVCTYNRTGCGSCKFQIICPSDEPIVEAIPIEWLRKRLVGRELFKSEFEKVLDDWRKEVDGKVYENAVD